jgi:hypothetical protein
MLLSADACLEKVADIFSICCKGVLSVPTNETKQLMTSPELIYTAVVKAKAVPLHAMKALGVRGDIVLTHSRPQH